MDCSVVTKGQERITYMKRVNIQSCAILEKKAWFVTVDNHFMWMDLNTGETHYVMPKGNTTFSNVIDPMIVIGREIYWADQNGKRFLSYNVDSEICKAYELNNIKVHNYVAYSLITKWEDKIILVPKYSDKIISFDTGKECFTEKSGIYKEYIVGGEEYVNHAFVLDEYIYVFLADNLTALQYSMSTGEICTVDRKSLKRGIISSYWCGNELYVLDSDGNVLAFNRNFELIRSYTDNDNQLEGYCCLFAMGNNLIILPSMAREIIVINAESASRKLIKTPNDMVYEDNNWGKYIGYTEEDDFILIPNRISNYVLVLNKNSFDSRWIMPAVPDNGEEARYMMYAGIDSFKEDNLGLLIEYICLNQNQSRKM